MTDAALRCPECGNFMHLDVISTDKIHVYRCQTVGVPGFIGANGSTREWTMDHREHFYAYVHDGYLRRVDIIEVNKKEGWYTWRLHTEVVGT